MRLRARCAATSSGLSMRWAIPEGCPRAGLSIAATFRHCVGQRGWFAGAGLYDFRNERRPQMQTERQPGQQPGAKALLDGVRVAITGGTSGLGLALVRELAGRGANIALVARTAARVAQVAAEEAV